jgi:flagellar biosynthesis/type III secretory pathway protein FliH
VPDDFDIDTFRKNLETMSREQLIEECVKWRINLEDAVSGLTEQADQAYESGGRKGYSEGFNDGKDECHR